MHGALGEDAGHTESMSTFMSRSFSFMFAFLSMEEGPERLLFMKEGK